MSDTGMQFIQPPKPDERIVAVKIVDHLTPMDMRSFDPVDRDMAFAWLLGEADAPSSM